MGKVNERLEVSAERHSSMREYEVVVRDLKTGNFGAKRVPDMSMTTGGEHVFTPKDLLDAAMALMEANEQAQGIRGPDWGGTATEGLVDVLRKDAEMLRAQRNEARERVAELTEKNEVCVPRETSPFHYGAEGAGKAMANLQNQLLTALDRVSELESGDEPPTGWKERDKAHCDRIGRDAAEIRRLRKEVELLSRAKSQSKGSEGLVRALRSENESLGRMVADYREKFENMLVEYQSHSSVAKAESVRRGPVICCDHGLDD